MPLLYCVLFPMNMYSVALPHHRIGDWGLRDYGLEPAVWGGDNGCKHEWVEKPMTLTHDNRNFQVGTQEECLEKSTGTTHIMSKSDMRQAFCKLCSAWRGNLGLEPTPELYVQHLVEVFREVRRVLRDDGTMFLNLGDSYWGPQGRGSGKGNEHNQKIKQSGGDFLKPKDLCMIPARVALALQADGWWLRSVIIWHKPSCMPESVTDRPTTSHEYVYLLAKSANYYYDADAIREPQIKGAAGSRFDTGKTAEHQLNRSQLGERPENKDNGRNKRTVWTINPEPTPYAHFATFPQKLVEPCIMAGTSEKGNCGKCGKPWVRVVETIKPKARQVESRTAPGQKPHGCLATERIDGPIQVKTTGWQPSCECHGKLVSETVYELAADGMVKIPHNVTVYKSNLALAEHPIVPPIVLDPFSGSGTVGVVAKKLQRQYVLIDLSAEYNNIAVDRLRQRELAL